MKRVTSAVWKFFERVMDNNRCCAVVCKLCENQYKYFGNTTNLRVHLINKHPIQWELSESGNLDESTIRVEESPAPKSETKKRKYGTRSADKNVDQSDTEVEDDTLNLVRQMHAEEVSGEEWLEEDPYQITHIETYEPTPKKKRVKYRTIKREVQSPTDLPGYYVAPKPEKIVYKEAPLRKDEYSVFGDYVANKLRNVKTARTRGNLQQLITTLLWQADYGLYDSAEAVKRVLMIPLQPDPEPEVLQNATVQFDHAPAMETIIDDTEDQDLTNEDEISVSKIE